MDMKNARRLAWANPRLPTTPPHLVAEAEDSDEDAALVAEYEAQQAAKADAECGHGCDYSDGPLSPMGSLW